MICGGQQLFLCTGNHLPLSIMEQGDIPTSWLQLWGKLLEIRFSKEFFKFGSFTVWAHHFESLWLDFLRCLTCVSQRQNVPNWWERCGD